MSIRLVAATANVKKLAEIRAMLDHLDVEVVPMTDLGVASPVEDGDTFEANALIKARACRVATALPAVADDSGLEVDALDGAPGVYSARYAGEDADDAANNAKLIAALRDVPDVQRTARFVSAVAFVTADGDEHVVRGTMEGRIVDEAAGEHGFGYDPYFVCDAAGGRTNAQLSPDEKNALSHRGAAFEAILPVVEAA
ncbi:MAG: RdgB/HAM1 family non-canonical purine NTP pyrophosphatase, partial [Egicoccus sp.]